MNDQPANLRQQLDNPDSVTPVLITAKGVADYVTCRRRWWLADFHEMAPGEELVAARRTLAQRERIARTLTIAGGIMVALAVLIVAVGLLIG